MRYEIDGIEFFHFVRHLQKHKIYPVFSHGCGQAGQDMSKVMKSNESA